MEMPVGITSGRQTEKWDGFHVVTEKELWFRKCEILSVAHMCARIAQYHIDTQTALKKTRLTHA